MFLCSPATIKACLCSKVLDWLKLDGPEEWTSVPSQVTCPCLHLALSQRVQSLFHWSAKTTDFVRGDGSQTELRQTVAIWETTDLCEPASPHHCLPCASIKGPIFHFCPLVKFMRNPWVYSMRNSPPQSRNTAA